MRVGDHVRILDGAHRTGVIVEHDRRAGVYRVECGGWHLWAQPSDLEPAEPASVWQTGIREPGWYWVRCDGGAPHLAHCDEHVPGLEYAGPLVPPV